MVVSNKRWRWTSRKMTVGQNNESHHPRERRSQGNKIWRGEDGSLGYLFFKRRRFPRLALDIRKSWQSCVEPLERSDAMRLQCRWCLKNQWLATHARRLFDTHYPSQSLCAPNLSKTKRRFCHVLSHLDSSMHSL